MKFKIHRGTNEIGGSCVEVRTESARILLDFGMPC
jgi:ribonuclease J